MNGPIGEAEVRAKIIYQEMKVRVPAMVLLLAGCAVGDGRGTEIIAFAMGQVIPEICAGLFSQIG